ncbi:MAG: polyphosphate kinase 1 [Planctomycetaceae bacterium]|nr:MAG: polyphosphate kinase 1 [Planctomycetaceae bacterium]
MATEMGDKMESTIGSDAFINRELSWLQFNLRVLEEAENPGNPLMERLKFLAIFSSNLDEFFMVRVAGVREQALGESAPQDFAPDGMRAIDQLKEIAAYTQELVARQYRCLRESIGPAMAAEGFELLRYDSLSAEQLEHIDRFFRERALPILTPMAVDPAHPSPQYHNRGLYLGVMLAQRQGLGPKQMFAVVQVPQVLPRIVGVPGGVAGQTPFVLLEEVIAARLPELFGGFEVRSWTTFRITRDSDLELLEQESDDMLRLIEERLKARQRGQAVRIEISAKVDESLARMIIDDEGLHAGIDNSYGEVYRIDGPLDLTGLWELYRLPGFDRFHDSYFTPCVPRGLGRRGEDIFTAIAHGDILLHHPYDSFDPVVDFVTSAANDPRVLAIKQTLYRTSGDSPISRALMAAAESGKHVTAIVELKARFDEANNVNWARRMEQAGVHVVFGFLDLKTHCKVSLVVRQEGQGLRRYVHLGTGNYNPTTALLYTDLGLFTADEEIAEDASALFNLLTGYSQGHAWRKLIIAPNDLQRRTLELIDEQAQLARNRQPSRIFIKLNSLVDHSVIEALYRASQAGVPIDIVARGICCLRPGLPGLSETIRVRSVVDRFLEHSRIYVFGPDNEAKVFLSSADWMPRNFVRRVEVMFPVLAAELVARILKEIVPVYLADNTRARQLDVDGRFNLIQPAAGEFAYRCQEEFLKQRVAVDSVTSSALDTSAGAVEQAAAVGG